MKNWNFQCLKNYYYFKLLFIYIRKNNWNKVSLLISITFTKFIFVYLYYKICQLQNLVLTSWSEIFIICYNLHIEILNIFQNHNKQTNIQQNSTDKIDNHNYNKLLYNNTDICLSIIFHSKLLPQIPLTL